MERKMQQKRAYDERAGQPLPNLAPQTHVYAKPPPTSPAKSWIPGQVVGPAGPRSYIIKTTSGHIRRNRTQLQESPPFDSQAPPLSSQPKLPDATVPNHLTAQSSKPYTLPCPTPSFPEPATSTNMEPLVVPTSEPNSLPQDPAPGSPALPARQTVTRSGRVVRRPARYSD